MTCPCEALPAKGDPKGATAEGLGKVKRTRSIGKGAHCVVSKKTGRKLGCYRDQSTAEKVARGFGPRFEVR